MRRLHWIIYNLLTNFLDHLRWHHHHHHLFLKRPSVPRHSGVRRFPLALGLFWDIVTGLPWTPNGVGSLEPRGYCIFLPGAHYLTINSPYGADSSLNKLLLLLLDVFPVSLHTSRNIALSGCNPSTFMSSFTHYPPSLPAPPIHGSILNFSVMIWHAQFY